MASFDFDCSLRPITFNVSVNPLSLVDDNMQSSIDIYPNPFSKTLSVSIIKPNAKEVSFSILNLNGKKITVFSDEDKSTYYKKVLDRSNLSNGVYFLETIIDEERIIRKMVKL